MIKKFLRIIYLNYVIPMFKLEKRYITKKFKNSLGYEIDFNKEPQSFNQKIQFRKVYDKNPLFTLCADKYKVREYVKNKIGEEYLIPIYLVTDKLTKEQWKSLPDSFVIKTNHGSGYVRIVYDKNKENSDLIIKEFNRYLKVKFGSKGQEYFYNKIKPKIIIEKLLLNKNNEIPSDIKFHCFNKKGKIKMLIQYDYDRFLDHKRKVYDENWNMLPFTIGHGFNKSQIHKPKNFEKMKEIAKKFSNDFDYVRVDLFNINGKIYFGELTFTHGCGFEKFDPPEYDFKIGELWCYERKK
jgi:hypothetical protein